MNIDNLTIGEARQIADMFGGAASQPTEWVTPHIGKRCVIRTYASGVFLGTLVHHSGRMVEVRDCRRLWTWKATDSISLSSVAVGGVDPAKCRFPETVPEMTILDALELIPASEKCLASVDACPIAVQI